MLSAPSDLSTDDIRAALALGWGITAGTVDYRAVGFGSHHWAVDGTRWFVTADRVSGALEPALRAAVELRGAGLEFVVAPVVTNGGRATQPAGGNYLLSVYPHVEGASGDFGPHEPDRRPEIVAMLARLHATPAPPTLEPLDLDVPRLDELQKARHTAGDGPYGRRATELLSAKSGLIDDLLGEYEELKATLPPPDEWVVTHGEPHPGNIMHTPGGLRLVDWDTARLAPAGRDLWFVDDSPAYIFFRRRWRLADIASFAGDLNMPHRDTEDTSAIFGYLRECLAYEDT
ncbi:aminoglycoside phosphotransferase family protein [Actinoplanes sp. NPDC051411]|uniref:aminoglycoside phosphotransferase family protein n=1 Tax=Actinoplanes sp. NPDC051411 TaxID=3155522 RepID=UPI0034224E59